MTLRKQLPWVCACLLSLAIGCARAHPALAEDMFAAGSIRGVGGMGYGASAPGARPRSSFGNTPGDYRRGYEGNMPGGDPWNREADFKARNYEIRHSPEPQYALPSSGERGTDLVEQPPLPTLPKPPLPGDRDMPADSPAPLAR